MVLVVVVAKEDGRYDTEDRRPLTTAVVSMASPPVVVKGPLLQRHFALPQYQLAPLSHFLFPLKEKTVPVGFVTSLVINIF